MNLNELYTQIITENSRSKENRHPVEGATHSLEGVNPSCGDDITLQLRVKDGAIHQCRLSCNRPPDDATLKFAEAVAKRILPAFKKGKSKAA